MVPEERLVVPDLLHLGLQLFALPAGLLLQLVHLPHQLRSHRRQLLLVLLFQLSAGGKRWGRNAQRRDERNVA